MIWWNKLWHVFRNWRKWRKFWKKKKQNRHNKRNKIKINKKITYNRKYNLNKNKNRSLQIHKIQNHSKNDDKKLYNHYLLK